MMKLKDNTEYQTKMKNWKFKALCCVLILGILSGCGAAENISDANANVEESSESTGNDVVVLPSNTMIDSTDDSTADVAHDSTDESAEGVVGDSADDSSTTLENLITPETISDGYWDSTGAYVSTTAVSHSDYIPVSIGNTYRVSVTFSDPQIVFFDKDYQFLSCVSREDEKESTIDRYVTIEDSDICYMSVQIHPTDAAFVYAYEVTTDSIPNQPLKVGFFGDSITDGYMIVDEEILFTHFSYHGILSTKLNLQTYKYAVSGVKLSGYDTMTTRIPSMRDDLDLIIAMIGTNDFTGAYDTIGTITDQQADTFYGALHVLFTELNAKYNNKPIIYLTPMEMHASLNDAKNGVGCTLEDYVNAVKEVAALYENVTVIDTYTWSKDAMPPFDSTLYTDGVHPTQEGHAKLAEFIYQELQKISIFAK